MPTAYILVGVPGSGKSTWIKNQTWMLGLNVVSTDTYVEDYAYKQGKTYSEVFEEYMPTAVSKMVGHVVFCRDNNLDIIWDQTSTTIETRAKKIRMLPEYTKIAVVFRTPEKEEWDRRILSRPGKHIPQHVLKSMCVNFDHPTLEEGFDQIWYAE
jgi:predicted kinase